MIDRPRVQTGLLGLLLALAIGTSAIAQENSHRAGVVISLENGQVLTRCVAFDEEQISGYELLNRTDLALDANIIGMGISVCQIQETGCPANDCFCKCKGGGPCNYWSYWHRKDTGWQYGQVGATAYQVSDGDVDGWVWGVGNPNEAPEPPDVTFAEICQPESPAATAAATLQLPPVASDQASLDDSGDATLPQATVEAKSDLLGTVNPSLGWPRYALFGLLATVIVVVFLIFRRQKEPS